jgi:hypothetical protein
MIFDAATLDLLREEKKAKSWITHLSTFAGNTYGPADYSNCILACSADGRVYIIHLSTLSTFHVIDIDTKRIPLSADVCMSNMYVRIAYSGERLMYYNLHNEMAEANANALKDVQWNTYNCPYHWNTQGMLAPYLLACFLVCVLGLIVAACILQVSSRSFWSVKSRIAL